MDNIDLLREFYGSQQAWADAWGVSQGAVSQWVSAGSVPVHRLLEIEMVTDGQLVAFVSGGRVVIDRARKES